MARGKRKSQEPPMSLEEIKARMQGATPESQAEEPAHEAEEQKEPLKSAAEIANPVPPQSKPTENNQTVVVVPAKYAKRFDLRRNPRTGELALIYSDSDVVLPDEWKNTQILFRKWAN